MTSSPAVPAPSYRALLDVPSLWRVLLGMTIARVGGVMVGIVMVLFTLTHYGSPVLAGAVTFASIMPGLLVSPIAGALLDRHGRAKLVILDYIVGATSMWLIGALALADALPPSLLLLIAAASSLTLPFSVSGLRSLLPLLVPPPLWERANAVDSNGYVIATLIGPPVAGGLVAVVGGAWAIIVIGAVFAVSALVLVRIPDPATAATSTGNLLLDAWQGLTYTVRNPTLRALAVSISTANLGGGLSQIIIPVIVLDRLGLGPAAVGVAWAVMGVTGMIAALIVGRMDSRGHEKQLMVWPQLAMAGAAALLLLVAGPGPIDPVVGLAIVIVSLGLIGLLNGPIDIGLFTIRQRRTDPAWMGRAFAVSMSLNFLGFPIGSALGGSLVETSLAIAIGVAVVSSLAAAAFTGWLLPATDPDAVSVESAHLERLREPAPERD